ncbi:hypothetical protein CEXT_761221 [Caerostris extrusa]|uniref:Uncharacterized protein n=1 Tax=Caerostris extrusa TaxID=172846 RepID=A0AAV4Q0N1_CAEEX|nr:hypothetical protein CEXT_761221 [Caerostris extrusa]
MTSWLNSQLMAFEIEFGIINPIPSVASTDSGSTYVIMTHEFFSTNLGDGFESATETILKSFGETVLQNKSGLFQ